MVDSGSRFSDRMWLKMEIVDGSGVGSWCVRSSGGWQMFIPGARSFINARFRV